MVEELMVTGLRTNQMEFDDSKEHLEIWISKINKIENEYQAKLFWDGKILNGNQLIKAIKSRVVALESRSDVKTIYLETINEQGNKAITEYGYKAHSTSEKNLEYEWLMNKVIEKDEAINKIDNFIFCFNRLERLFRIILYYTLFKRESALKISQMRLDGNFTYSSRTVLRKRAEGIDKFAKMLQCVEWLKTKERSENV